MHNRPSSESDLKNLCSLAADPNGFSAVCAALNTTAGTLLIDAPHPEGGQTPVYYAAKKGSLDTLRHLIKKGADVKAAYGRANLLEAALYNNKSVRKYLTDQNEKLWSHFKDGTQDIHAACASGLLDWVNKLLLSDQDNILKVNYAGRTPLFFANAAGERRVADYLNNYLLAHTSIQVDVNYRMQAAYGEALWYYQHEKNVDQAKLALEKAIEEWAKLNGHSISEQLSYIIFDCLELYALVTFQAARLFSDQQCYFRAQEYLASAYEYLEKAKDIFNDHLSLRASFADKKRVESYHNWFAEFNDLSREIEIKNIPQATSSEEESSASSVKSTMRTAYKN